jgi:rhodanese-related sulfurtransferase
MATPTEIPEISPRDAWALLERDPKSVLVDVRTEPEWGFVGLPDLSPLGKQVVRLSWQIYPAMAVDPGFAERLAATGITPEHSLLFLCRSGARSLAAARLMAAQGFARCYNVSDGFEGPADGTRHRGTVAGWKHDGLPWVQG